MSLWLVRIFVKRRGHQLNLRVRQKKELGAYTIEWVDSEGYIFSKLNSLYTAKDLDTQPKFFAKFPAPKSREVLAQVRTVQRALRFLYYNVIKIDKDQLFVTFQKNVGLFKNGKFTPITGLRRPSRFLRGGVAVDEEGGVFLGEYLPNTKRGEIFVYYLKPGSTHLEVVHTFGPHEIRHIHGIYFDPYDNCIWTLTGDLPGECKILRTSDKFRTTDVIGAGDETWRAVSIVFREEAMYYATDAEFQQNHVFKIDRKSRTRSLLFDVDGPVYYSTQTKSHIFFGVTAENCPSQKENRAYLWSLNESDEAQLVANYRKDLFPNFLMPGTIHFALGHETESLYFSCVGLSQTDNKTFEISLNR